MALNSENEKYKTYYTHGDFLWRWGTDAAVNEGPLLQICVILCLKDIFI
jgi:hypothetical protein